MPVRQTVDYSLQIVQGLIAAHDHHIIHRDIKPENLFVTTDGRVKILDFEVAKQQSAPAESPRSLEDLTTITKSGAVIGTVACMSPEQLRGKAVDHRSDIFSVGAILYETLTGRGAFLGDTEVDTITAVLREDPPEIDLQQAGIPASFEQIVRHCLEKDPEQRFQSARDLGFALQTVSTPIEVSAAKPRSTDFQAKVLPWALAGLFLVALLLLAGSSSHSQLANPVYQRLTFEEGTVYSARFTPDFHSIVYGAAWNNKPLQLFSTVGDSILTQPLNVTDAGLLAISRSANLPWPYMART